MLLIHTFSVLSLQLPEETTVVQQVSHRPIKCQSRSWSQRGTTINGPNHGDNPLLKPTRTQIATKPLPGSTNQKHRRLIGVKTMSLVTNYSLYYLECYKYFRIRITSYRKDCLMCCPSNKVIKRYTRSCLALGGLLEDMLCDTFTSNCTDQHPNGSPNLLTPYREQPRSTRTIIAYPRPAFSATKRANHASISVDQQDQIYQGHARHAEISKPEIPMSMKVEVFSW